MAVGDQMTCTCTETDCTGAHFSVSGTWSSSNTSVMTVASTTGMVTGVSPGTATISVDLGIMQMGSGCIPNGCPTGHPVPSTGGTCRPTVNIQGGDFAFVGHDPTVVSSNLFVASGQPSGGTFQWSSTDSNITFDNPNAATVHPTVGFPSSTLHDKSISVAYTLNSQTGNATSAITARIFKFLIQHSAVPQTFNGPNIFGYELDILYDVYTNPSGQLVPPGFSGIVTFENVTQTSSNVTINPHTSSGTTDQNSEVPDMLKLVANQPLPAGLQIVDSQDLGVGGFFVRNNTLTWSSTGVTVTNNGPTN